MLSIFWNIREYFSDIHFYLLVSSLLLLNYVLHAQVENFSFSIEGQINADSGEVILAPFYIQDYYLGKQEQILAEVKDGKFTIQGQLPYPQAYTLQYGRQYRSRLFIIEKGNQSMKVDIETGREVPFINNQSMNEYQGPYTKAYETVNLKRDQYYAKSDSLRQHYGEELPDSIQFALESEINSIYASSDSVLLKYVTSHPNSYFAFWKFIDLFSFDGSNPIFNAIYAQFSDSLKNTHAGKVLGSKLESASAMALGKEFPVLYAVDANAIPLAKAVIDKNKYTFVDFWYSNCAPCIAQFPHLRETYAKYKDKGFQIIGISTDKERYEENWLKAIDNYELSWPQYWDKDGEESAQYSINKFPTNYLLDSEGKIIKKDLRPVELELFLKENI